VGPSGSDSRDQEVIPPAHYSAQRQQNGGGAISGDREASLVGGAPSQQPAENLENGPADPGAVMTHKLDVGITEPGSFKGQPRASRAIKSNMLRLVEVIPIALETPRCECIPVTCEGYQHTARAQEGSHLAEDSDVRGNVLKHIHHEDKVKPLRPIELLNRRLEDRKTAFACGRSGPGVKLHATPVPDRGKLRKQSSIPASNVKYALVRLLQKTARKKVTKPSERKSAAVANRHAFPSFPRLLGRADHPSMPALPTAQDLCTAMPRCGYRLSDRARTVGTYWTTLRTRHGCSNDHTRALAP
jgi:hypothetical protein